MTVLVYIDRKKIRLKHFAVKIQMQLQIVCIHELAQRVKGDLNQHLVYYIKDEPALMILAFRNGKYTFCLLLCKYRCVYVSQLKI